MTVGFLIANVIWQVWRSEILEMVVVVVGFVFLLLLLLMMSACFNPFVLFPLAFPLSGAFA